jgi:hypothetical protein
VPDLKQDEEYKGDEEGDEGGGVNGDLKEMHLSAV